MQGMQHVLEARGHGLRQHEACALSDLVTMRGFGTLGCTLLWPSGRVNVGPRPSNHIITRFSMLLFFS